MAPFSGDIKGIPAAVRSAPLTSHLFILRNHGVKIWEVSMTSSHMIFETKHTPWIKSICPSHDGRRILVGSGDGIVRMWDMNLVRKQPVTMDTQDDGDMREVSHSGKMVATISKRSIELRNTTTSEVVRRMDNESHVEIAFSPDDSQVAVLSDSLITLWDINNLENCLSFNPWPTGRGPVHNWKVAFQTNNHVVICAGLLRDDDNSDLLLQVWHVTGRTCSFSLDIRILKYPLIYLAPDGLTAVISSGTVLCYSWNHDTAQFRPFHFTDQESFGYPLVYSSDGKLVACHCDNDVRVWDTRTGQLCGNPIMVLGWVMALSPALNNQSLGNRLIAIRCWDTNTTSLFDVYTGHLYAQFWSQRSRMAFIRDGTKLMTSVRPLIIRDTADLTVKHRDGYQVNLRDMKGGWMTDQDNESLFWVPVKYRENLCPLPQFETIWGQSTKLNLSRFRYGNVWTECIDKEWLKKLEEKEKKMGSLLG